MQLLVIGPCHILFFIAKGLSSKFEWTSKSEAPLWPFLDTYNFTAMLIIFPVSRSHCKWNFCMVGNKITPQQVEVAAWKWKFFSDRILNIEDGHRSIQCLWASLKRLYAFLHKAKLHAKQVMLYMPSRYTLPSAWKGKQL